MVRGKTPPVALSRAQALTAAAAAAQHTLRMQQFLAKRFEETGEQELSFEALRKNQKRKVQVQTFYELLILKSSAVIEVAQDEPYGDIAIAKGAKFSDFSTA